MGAVHGAAEGVALGEQHHGAVDEVLEFLAECARQGVPRQRLHIHVDAAMGGLFAAAQGFQLHSRLGEHYDSICVSGQKFFGSPVPFSMLLVEKSVVEAYFSKVQYAAYVKSADATIEHSRSGWPALFMKYKFDTLGLEGLLQCARSCLDQARWLTEELHRRGVAAEFTGLTPCVVFEKPSQEIVDAYSLMVVGSRAQVICMPHVGRPLLTRLLDEMCPAPRPLTKSRSPSEQISVE